MKTVIVCIAKDEDHYFEEWCDYHKKLGFDEVYVYENDWSCPIDRDYLTKIPISGKHKQMDAYRHFTDNYRNSFDWAAFIDCDEFIVLKKHKNIQEFLTEYDNPYGVGINWQFFGPNGRMERGEYPNSLLKQFYLKQKDTDRHVKTIMKLSSGGVMSLPHNPNTPLLGTNKSMFSGPFNPDGDIDVAQLNHYHHKTYEDWLIRCNRGQADYCETRKPHQWMDQQYVFCDVEDYDAYNFMYKNFENQVQG
jgi:hypothetical protein